MLNIAWLAIFDTHFEEKEGSREKKNLMCQKNLFIKTMAWLKILRSSRTLMNVLNEMGKHNSPAFDWL